MDDSEGELLRLNQETVKHFEKTSLNIKHLTHFSDGIDARHKRVANSGRKSLDMVETDFLTFMAKGHPPKELTVW